MNKEFEEIIKKLSPTLRRITHKLNGHFTFFDEDDLFQEALEHIWILFEEGGLEDNTDSYILQGCFYHLKNYIRKTTDKANLISLNQMIDEEDSTLEDLLACDDKKSMDGVDCSFLKEGARKNGLAGREMKILSLTLEGLTIREIGQRLGISHVMVIKLKKRIKVKCEVFKNSLKEGYQN